MRRRTALKLAAGATGGYALLGGAVRVGYRTFLFPAPRRRLSATPDGAQLLQVPASDGAPVQLLWFPPAGGARVIAYFHGNGETIADGVPLAQALVRRGLGVALVEYRGYGGSAARGPSEAGLYADAQGALFALHERGHGPGQIALWGSSLGSGVATEMALRGHGARLLLTAPFTSIPEVARRFLPFLPMDSLIADRFDNLRKAPHIGVPVLIFHGDDDRVVPYDMGVTLSAALARAELVTVPKGGHNDLFAREPGLIDRAAAFATG